MSRVFVDTSALFALLVAGDAAHARAAAAFHKLAARRAPLFTTSYVLVETVALLGRRVGLRAVGVFRERLQPLLDVVWVDQELHDTGMESMLAREDRSLSLVDTVSFLVMQRDGAHEALAFDRHFEDEGFSIVV